MTTSTDCLLMRCSKSALMRTAEPALAGWGLARYFVAERDREDQQVLGADDARCVPGAGRIFQKQRAAWREAPHRSVAGGHLVVATEGAHQLAMRRRVRDAPIPANRGTHQARALRREERGDVEWRGRRSEFGRFQIHLDVSKVRLATLVRIEPYVARFVRLRVRVGAHAT